MLIGDTNGFVPIALNRIGRRFPLIPGLSGRLPYRMQRIQDLAGRPLRTLSK
jgi:hypothetical protein